MAAHRWVVKLMFWEEVVRVPFLLSHKGVIPAGAVDSERLVSALDIMPTLCDYAGITPPQPQRGMSLRPLIEDRGKPGREFLVVEIQPDPERMDLKGRVVRTQRHKYVAFSHGSRREMLFDLAADPLEMNDIAPLPDSKPELQRRRKLLRQWIAETGDSFDVPGDA
jgi:arylsulfatase A-like enzyme